MYILIIIIDTFAACRVSVNGSAYACLPHIYNKIQTKQPGRELKTSRSYAKCADKVREEVREENSIFCLTIVSTTQVEKSGERKNV